MKHGRNASTKRGTAKRSSPSRCLGACAVVVLIFGLASAPGCVSFGRNPVAPNLATARELSLQGMDAVQQGDLQEAESLFGDAVDVCPEDERARRHFADVLWRRGDVDEAIEHMQQAVRLSAGDPKLMVRLGEMHLSRGDLNRAEELADQSIRRNRQLASAWALQGEVLKHRGEDDEALASYHRALCYQEHYPRVQLSVAELYRRMGRPQRSLATLIALADQYPPGQAPQEVFYRQGLALKTLGRYAEAVESFATAAARAKPTADLLYQMAETRLLTGDEANAHLALQAALQADPQHRGSRQLDTQLKQLQEGRTAMFDR